MGRKKKNEYDDLDSDFKSLVENMKDEEIRSKIAEVAMNQVELMKAKTADQDLAEKKTAAKMAGEMYRDGSKMNRLRIEYARQILENRGKV